MINPENQTNGQSMTTTGRKSRRSVRLAVLTLVATSAVAGTCLACWFQEATPPPAHAAEAASAKTQQTLQIPDTLFRNWPKPDLVLVLTGQQHGYMAPCGCSDPQKGGLERRYNFIELLRQKGWPLVALDVGDIPQRSGPASLPNHQGLLKYIYSMRALQTIGYQAVGLGEYEAALGWDKVLGEWALNEATPHVLIGNVKNRDDLFPGHLGLASWVPVTTPGSSIKVGVAGIFGADVAKPDVTNLLKNQGISFIPSKPAITDMLKEMDAQKVDFRVLFYQGLATTRNGSKPPAIACAEAFPQIQVEVCLSEEDEPSSDPIKVGGRYVVSLGQKGKYVGVVGVYKTDDPKQPFNLRYQLVELGEEYKTPDEKRENNPIYKLLQEYANRLKKDNYLAMYGQTKHPLQVAVPGKMPKYVGSEQCQECHAAAYEVWKESKHSHAYATLANKPKPTNRQFDAECIVCHTVGFGYVSGFENEKKTPKLENVGCESCHGPGSEHIAAKKDPVWRALLDPWKEKPGATPADKAQRLVTMDLMCQKCHDIENDVHWRQNGGFEKQWQKIAHMKNAAPVPAVNTPPIPAPPVVPVTLQPSNR